MKLILYATLREIAGTSELTFSMGEPRSLLGFLDELAMKFGDEWKTTIFHDRGGFSQYVRVYLNGEEVDKAGDALVTDRDEVEILVPMAGG
jgi:molybdopterin converting factor small subunit